MLGTVVDHQADHARVGLRPSLCTKDAQDQAPDLQTVCISSSVLVPVGFYLFIYLFFVFVFVFGFVFLPLLLIASPILQSINLS